MSTWIDSLAAWMRGGTAWGGPLRVDLLDATTLSVTAARVLAHTPGTVLAVTADSRAAEHLAAALRTFQEWLGDARPLVVVPEVTGPRNQWVPENEAARCAALDQACHGPAGVFVLSVGALLAPTVPPTAFRDQTFVLRPGEEGWSPESLAERLVSLDYDNEYEVHVPGEFSRRGGLLDVYSPAHDRPVRVEFFGNTIDSLRAFDPESQRSCGEVAEVRVVPRGEMAVAGATEAGHSFWEYLGPEAPLVVCEPDGIREHIERYLDAADLRRWEAGLAAAQRPVLLEVTPVDAPAAASAAATCPRVQADCLGLRDVLGVLLPELGASGPVWHWQQLCTHLQRWHHEQRTIVACCGSPGEVQRFRERLAEDTALAAVPIVLETAALDAGFVLPSANLVVLSETELFARRPETRRRQAVSRYRADHAFRENAEIEEGRHAVHAAQGICIYRGLRHLEIDGRTQEVLDLEFDEGAHLYVPLDQAYLVSRYVGGTRKVPKLSRLGGAAWKTAKAAAMAAATDLAAELLRLEAMRRHATGVAFQPSAWDRAFANAFAYTETEDQAQAIRDVLEDMERPQPMDRLLCGDVGYGKTEVAMRAAFRTVMNGKQVAVLVPTTVLAQQHALTFRERLADYPVRVEVLSRFRTHAEQELILADLAIAKVDIVIGTHRLIGEDVAFHDLGLLVIDEEQRFGVKHKEKLKRLRASVDILTMTATPIPRTLYFSLAGLRHLSTIMTPPADRLPVNTIVAPANDALVREAITRELERKGQVFFLHNRVQTIRWRCDRLRRLVPDARFAVAHGQMPPAELEEVMSRFVLGEIDVLVCTTIIESGLDIPNTNTIIIDRADRFGLAELYQLRGRVGRYHNQAYAYLLLPPMGSLPANARERLSAIRRYTHLGAGLKLALRDLEIRGAGNILGTEQSGHIAAVGFELYCQLLREAVERLSLGRSLRHECIPVQMDFLTYGEDAREGRVAAAIPASYVGAENVRLECYRRVTEADRDEDIAKLEDELNDRFGAPPPVVRNLLEVSRIRAAAGRVAVSGVTVRQERLFLQTERGYVRDHEGEIPILQADTPQDMLGEVRTRLELLATTGRVDPDLA